jgi:hypothetical protein
VTARYLGSLSVGAALPGAQAAAVAGAAGINAALPSLTGQLAALMAFKPTAISITAQIAQLEAMIGGLTAQLAVGLQPPSLVSQLAAIAALVAELEATISGISGQLSIVAAFQSLLSAAGVHAVAFEGPLASFGSDVGTVVATAPGVSPADQAYAITLVTTLPATWSALAAILKVSP